METLSRSSELSPKTVFDALTQTITKKGTDHRNNPPWINPKDGSIMLEFSKTQLTLMGRDGGSAIISTRNDAGVSEVADLNNTLISVSGNIFQDPGAIGILLVSLSDVIAHKQRAHEDFADQVAYDENDYEALLGRLDNYEPKIYLPTYRTATS